VITIDVFPNLKAARYQDSNIWHSTTMGNIAYRYR